jgi:hypothetical protein
MNEDEINLQEQFSFLKLSIGAKAIIYPQYQVSE